MNGSKYERELYKKIVRQSGCRVIRTAGSGTMSGSDCDLLAGRKGKSWAIEAKKRRKKSVYLTKDEVKRLKNFAEEFGAKPVVAVRFVRVKGFKGMNWKFLQLKDLEETENSWKITREIAKERGLNYLFVLK
ncbi:MAG: Holliday junction resolvase Hjc [Promethearchaeota archaeon]